MFEDFFGFQTRPFGKTPDPAFLFESPQHKEVFQLFADKFRHVVYIRLGGSQRNVAEHVCRGL